MTANFIKIDSSETLAELFERSFETPVALFKHSNTCGISADIYQQVAEVNGDVNIVVVQESRAISNEIEARTGIRHASPQAFVIKDGKPVYQSSHYGINPKDIEAKLAS